MNEEEKINEEIRNFLNLGPSQTKDFKDLEKPQTKDNIKDLLALIRELNRTHETVRYENKEDNLVLNGKLINLIRNVLNERKDKEMEIRQREDDVRRLEHKIDNMDKEFAREKNGVKYKAVTNKELNRIIKDQSERIKNMKERYENERQTSETMKNVNEELNIVKNKYLNKIESMEKQLKLYDDYMTDKNKEILEIKKDSNGQKAFVNNLENSLKEANLRNDKLALDIEQKNDIIATLNKELSKIIRNNDSKYQDYSSWKEKADYYEKLYRSTSQQNEYLNSQLSKMINIKNINIIKKDIEFNNKPDGDIAEQRKMPNDIFRTPLNTAKDVNKEQESELVSRISDLELTHKKKRRYFRKKLNEHLERIKSNKNLNKRLNMDIEEKNQAIQDYERKINELRKNKEQPNLNYKEINEKLLEKVADLMENNRQKNDEIFRLKKQNIESPHKAYNFKEPRETKGNDLVKLYMENNNESFKSIIERDEIRNTPQVENNEYDEELKQLRQYIQNDDFTKYLMNENKPIFKSKDPVVKKDDILINNDPSDAIFDRIETDSDISFIKRDWGNYKEVENAEANLSTTSSLRNMLEKTDNLKKKFDDLEEKLGNFKNNKKIIPDKIKEKLKTYDGYYFSDIEDFKNNPDVF